MGRELNQLTAVKKICEKKAEEKRGEKIGLICGPSHAAREWVKFRSS